MERKERIKSIHYALLIVASIIGMFFWLAMTTFAFLMGGSPGPGYERTVPINYVVIIALGFVSTASALAIGKKKMRGFSKITAIILLVLLVVSASIPLFLLELTEIAAIAIVIGFLPICFLFLIKKSTKKNSNCALIVSITCLKRVAVFM